MNSVVNRSVDSGAKAGALQPAVWPDAIHGGPDAMGVPLHDFSTNANACGPCPLAMAAVQKADRSRYPDPTYSALRAQLAGFHGVAPARIVVAASASEFIHRITAYGVGTGLRQVALPAHGYGDYRRAADVWGLVPGTPDTPHALRWACEPGSPLGAADAVLAQWRSATSTPPHGALRAIDCAYAPLRLDGAKPQLPADAWQLWSANKALGMTGVRGAYAIAPDAAQAAAVRALAPSWPLGADGVALLGAWVEAGTQAWLAQSLESLRTWKATQLQLCADLGWPVLAGSLANFFTARPSVADLPAALQALREQGIKLRDCASFGLPGHVRLGVLPPASQQALRAAWQALGPGYHSA